MRRATAYRLAPVTGLLSGLVLRDSVSAGQVVGRAWLPGVRQAIRFRALSRIMAERNFILG